MSSGIFFVRGNFDKFADISLVSSGISLVSMGNFGEFGHMLGEYNYTSLYIVYLFHFYFKNFVYIHKIE